MNPPLSADHLLNRLNANAKRLCDQTIEQSERLGVAVNSIGGATILDFAVGRTGTLAAGIRLAEICLADLATVTLLPAHQVELPLPRVQVTTDFPLASCMASQYAGWPVSVDKFFAMCSGPARMLRGQEDVLTEYNLTCDSECAVVVFEANQLPDEAVINNVAEACGVSPSSVTICIARTASFPGSLQVVARSVETTLHKLHELKFDLATIRNGLGSAPLPPIAADDLTALGWTNDAILYGGQVHLWVDTTDKAITSIGDKLPSSSSSDFGEPFLTIFNRYERDFYKIDKLLFSPAQVIINNLKTGRTFSFGSLCPDVLRSSYGV